MTPPRPKSRKRSTAAALKAESSLHSTFYENMTEHVFLSELIQEAWFGFSEKIEVLRSEVDDSGYDLALECNGTLRHIRLKTSSAEAQTARQTINAALAKKPSGCVVWILRDEDRYNRRMSFTYRFFGAKPGRRMQSMRAFPKGKNAKGGATRLKNGHSNSRVIAKGKFKKVRNMGHLLELLFGLKP